MGLYFHGLPGGAGELSLAGSAHIPDLTVCSPGTRDAEDALATLAGPQRIAGFSLGAFAALRLAAEQPERVAELILISPAGPLELGDFTRDMAGGAIFDVARKRPRVFRGLTHVQAFGSRIAPAALLDAMFRGADPSEQALLDDPDIHARLLDGLQRTYGLRRAFYIQTVQDYVAPWADILGGIKSPVHIYQGGVDSWTPPAMVEALAKALPNKPQQTRLPKLGHYGVLRYVLENGVLEA